MNKNKFNRQALKVSIFITLVLGLLVFRIRVMADASYSESEQDASPIALSGLPEDSQLINAFEKAVESTSHPLGLGLDENGSVREADPEKEMLYTYNEVSSTGYVMPSAGGVVFVYEYTYDSPDAAETSHELFWDGIRVELPAEASLIQITPSSSGIQFTTIEGDVVYWYSNVQEDVFRLLMVNGTESEQLDRVFMEMATGLDNLSPTSVSLSASGYSTDRVKNVLPVLLSISLAITAILLAAKMRTKGH